MGNQLGLEDINAFLNQLATDFNQPTKLYLLGGSALNLLGHPRRTLDIDLTAIPFPQELKTTIAKIEKLLKIEIEEVPIHEFIPIPKQAETRHIHITTINALEVFVYDPYSIALSKLARGFETDLQDILFLLQESIIELNKLSEFMEEALPKAWDFDIDPKDMKKYFAEVKRLYN